jgi:chlorophyll synthase
VSAPCSQALFGELSWDVTILTVLYSIAGLGIAIVNDFKSIEGDKCATCGHASTVGSETMRWHI